MKILQTKRYSIYKNLVLQDERSKKLCFKPDGREHYVYRITDYTRDEKEHYIGSHTPSKGKVYSNLIDEFWTYKTSSKYNVLNEDKKENYKIKILRVFDNPADKIIYEAFLHQYHDVKLSNKFWNETNQGPLNWSNTNMIVTSERLWVTREEFIMGKHKGLMSGIKHEISYNKNMVVTKKGKRVGIDEFQNSNDVGIMHNMFTGFDRKGNRVCKEKDESFNKELYIGFHKNKVVVMDNEGNKFQVNKDDKRYLSGELTGHTKGKVSAKDKEDNIYYISVDDKRYLSGELVNINKDTMPIPHNVKTIKIFDNENNLVYVSREGFHTFCIERNLPYNFLRQSFINGTKLGERNRETTSLINKGYKRYLGWYAKIK
jgi:hypothetical protein